MIFVDLLILHYKTSCIGNDFCWFVDFTLQNIMYWEWFLLICWFYITKHHVLGMIFADLLLLHYKTSCIRNLIFADLLLLHYKTSCFGNLILLISCRQKKSQTKEHTKLKWLIVVTRTYLWYFGVSKYRKSFKHILVIVMMHQRGGFSLKIRNMGNEKNMKLAEASYLSTFWRFHGGESTKWPFSMDILSKAAHALKIMTISMGEMFGNFI